ncbi:MAG: SH3 domain-containing protein [Planctomycetota bacterium]
MRAVLTFLLVGSSVFAQTYGESPFLFGIHDPGGERHMAEKGRRGWILFTEEVGRNAQNLSGRDYRPWADQGYGLLVRINHGYGPTNGTLPYQRHYADFARRVANFVAASPGAHIWIIGNETNLPGEWPRYEGAEERITAQMYVDCFRRCRQAIKALPGHSGDQVVTQGVATWAAVIGQGWVEYHLEILNSLGQGGLDGVALHTYTHGSDPNLIFSEATMNAPYQTRRFHFRAYRDYLNAHPTWARSLPAYITETDQNDAWADANSGWVRNAYREINSWNSTVGTQAIRALVLYRWPRADQWFIEGKQGVIDDWRMAMDNDYRWPRPQGTPALTAVRVNALTLNVRSGAGMSFPIIGQVRQGQVYFSGARSNGWYQIRYDQRTGWCSGSFLREVRGLTGVRITTLVNARTNPSFANNVLGLCNVGSRFCQVATSGSWRQIWYRGQAAWIWGAYGSPFGW